MIDLSQYRALTQPTKGRVQFNWLLINNADDEFERHSLIECLCVPDGLDLP